MGRGRTIGVVLGAALLAAPVLAMAGPAVDEAGKAEKFAGEGKIDEALNAIESAKASIWEKTPLSFGKSLFVASDPQGFGIYDVRENSTFKPGEPLVVYFEPRGYGFGRDGAIYLIEMALDFEVALATGQSLYKQEKFAKLSLRSRFPNKEFMGKLTYDFSGIPPGNYVVKTTVTCAKSGKVGNFSLPFTLVVN